MQIGGYWWNDRTEEDKNSVNNLSPTENFIRTSYMYNYLLHSTRVKDLRELSDDFKEYLGDDILRNIDNPDIPLNLFKQDLPREYYKHMNNLIFKRNIHDPSGHMLNHQLDKLGNPIHIVPTPKVLLDNIHDPEMGKNLEDLLHQNAKYDVDHWSNIYNNKKPNEFIENFIRFIKNKVLIPCTSVEESSWISTGDNLPELPDVDTPHITYKEFITHGVDIEHKSEVFKRLYSSIHKNDKNLINNNTRLYWIDIYELAFKHPYVINSGKTTGRNTYTLISNAKHIASNKNFYTSLMRNVGHGISADQKVILPLAVFMIGNRLYSHDHKRIFASIMGGNRYILGMISQNLDVIKKREIGYRPTKCVFSLRDKQLLLLLQENEIIRYGNYFFHIGKPSDYTSFMQYIVDSAMSPKRFEEALLHDTPRFKEEDIVDNILFKILHRPCHETFFTSLDNRDYLVSWYNLKLNDLLRQLNNVMHEFKIMRDREGEGGGEGEVLVGGNRTSEYFNKYIKYKTRYLNLKNQIGGDNFFKKLHNILTEKIKWSDVSRDEKTNFINEVALAYTKTRVPINRQNIEKVLEFFSGDEKTQFNAKFNELRKPDTTLSNVRTGNNKSNGLKDIGAILREFSIKPNGAVGLFIKCYVPYIDTDIKQYMAHILENFATIIEKLREYGVAQLEYINNEERTINQLLEWELNTIGNSFWYVFRNKYIHQGIKDHISAKYPFVAEMDSTKNLKIKNTEYVNREGMKYSKTDNPILEDLVLMMRHGPEFKLEKTQLHTLDEINKWQKLPYLSTKLKYLTIPIFGSIYPELEDGYITHDFMSNIIYSQPIDHLRIFSKVKNIDGVDTIFYGAYQGLSEESPYTELHECPIEMKYTVHLSKEPILQKILNNEDTLVQGYATLPGHLELLGRYIHGLGWVDHDGHGNFSLSDKWDRYKGRLYRRFRQRVGVVVNMDVLRDYYTKQGTAWNKVCGINELFTVIFLKRVPPQAIIAKDREIIEDCIMSPGTPYTMQELFKME